MNLDSRDGFLIKHAAGKGFGIYALRSFAVSETLLTFGGPVLRTSELPQLRPDEEEHYLQIGPEKYLGPSGDIDDFVNHSCSPNSAVAIRGESVTLVVVEPIAAGEEITFDYSLTSTESTDTWAMPCRCGRATCRHIISGYRSLPDDVRDDYARRGLVPWYLVTLGEVIAWSVSL